MPLSLTSLFLGFVLGVAATAIAWALVQPAARRPQEKAKVTALWSIHDVVEPGHRPAVIAEHLEGVSLPSGSKVVVPAEGIHKVPAGILAACEVRMHPDVRMNAAIGKDRALLFSGQMSPKTHAVLTTEPSAVHRLQGDFSRMWSESTPYVERAQIHELAEKDGRHVDVTGRALEVIEYRGRKMLRLADNKASVGVVTTQEDVAQYSGGVVRVVGRMHRDGGHSYIEATSVTLVETPTRAVPA